MAKSKYETHVLPYLGKIALWVSKGASAKEVAKKLSVAYSTFRKYLDLGEKGDERYMALSACFTQAREEPNDEVEAALFKRACGIAYEEKTFETKWNDAVGDFVEVCTKRVTKFIPPDPTSIMFYLTNLMPEKYQYKPEKKERDDDSSTGVIQLPAVMEVPDDGK